MAARKPPGQRALSEAEKDLWTQVTQDVKPINVSEPPPMTDLVQSLNEQETVTKRTARKRRPVVSSAPTNTPMPSGPPALVPGQTDMMDKRTARRLKRGQLGIDARLDLHGHVQATAHRSLERFIEDSFHQGHRTVLVITGKGNRGTGQVGVLKEAVPRWLNQMPIRDWVTGFSYAAVKDGGDGALYVRIKRRR